MELATFMVDERVMPECLLSKEKLAAGSPSLIGVTLVSQLHTSPSILSQVAKLLGLIPAKSCLLGSFKIFVLTQLLLLSLTLKHLLTCRLEQKAT